MIQIWSPLWDLIRRHVPEAPENGAQFTLEEMWAYADRTNNRQLVHILYVNDLTRSTIRHGPIWALDCLFLMGVNDIKWRNRCYEDAIQYGRIDVVNWLYAHGVPLQHRKECLLMFAMNHGDLDIMNWLHAHGYRSSKPCRLYTSIVENHPTNDPGLAGGLVGHARVRQTTLNK